MVRALAPAKARGATARRANGRPGLGLPGTRLRGAAVAASPRRPLPCRGQRRGGAAVQARPEVTPAGTPAVAVTAAASRSTRW